MATILVVEDDPAVSKALEVLFELQGYDCRIARGPQEAVAALGAPNEPESAAVDLVVQDMNFSPGATSGDEGVALFRDLHRRAPHLPVLLITAWTRLETAVQLIKEGASDYLAKPWDDDKLLATVRNLLRAGELERENARLREQVRRGPLAGVDLQGAVCESPAMREVLALAVQVAPSNVPVLITGPSGAGKEKVAEVLQAASGRRHGPFVKVNAGALPDELLESELFGAESGAFTGARRRTGRFEAADGGTLFLDEIGNLSPSGQMKLLRVLQSGEFERLGSSQTRKVDVRLLCATNADLRQEIAAGRFREDLYFRLNVIELHVPPLAERPEDVLPLARTFLDALGPSLRGSRWELSQTAADSLLTHPWPGNVRELKNALHRATLVAAGDVLQPRDLGLETASVVTPSPPIRTPPSPSAAGAPRDPARREVETALEQAGGVVATAARALGLSRQALYRRMARLGITLEKRVR